MRKLLKFIFSRLFIGGFLLILQLCIILMSILRINEYFLYFDIFLKLVSLVTVVIIINRHVNPMYKLAWVVPILIFPMFGGLLYLFASGQLYTKMFFRKLSDAEKKITSLCPQNEKIISEIEEIHPERKNTVSFINSVSGNCAYRCEKAQYFSVGEEMLESLKEELKKAEKYIFL